MESKKYLSLANDIRSKVEALFDEYRSFEPSISNVFFDGMPLYEQAVKFTLLVYSFDPNLPLNRELADLQGKCKAPLLKSSPNGDNVFKEFLFFLECFTGYLATFRV